MKKELLLITLIITLPMLVIGQNYTTFFDGNTTDIVTTSASGVCLMGGATEDDNAMRWFLQRANGGDVLVLRASGSNGYQNYFYSQLGISVNSVETIVFNDATAANEPYIHDKISKAEAIWFAGGDQWDYISYWRNSPIDSLINDGLSNRNIVIGGTSAGMAILGSYYFSAEAGTVTSATALNNPYDNRVRVDTTSFLKTDYLGQVITDTHYDNPDRKGRQVTFLARALTDWGVEAMGIACDEYTAVCIDNNGIASVYGDYPTYDDNAYFLQVNCENASTSPENCMNTQPLNWNLGGTALKVYKIKGTSNGSNTFNVKTWKSGTGGTWEHWSVINGALQETAGTSINCTSVNVDNVILKEAIRIFPTPNHTNVLKIESEELIESITILDLNGRLIQSYFNYSVGEELNVSELDSGLFFIKIKTRKGNVVTRKFIKER